MTFDLVLPQLEIEPQTIKELSSRTRTRLLQHLMRWQSYDEAIQCLDFLAVERYVSLQDFYARALLGLGRIDEATQVMYDRLQQRQSQAAVVLLGRCLLAQGEHASALEMAEELTTQHPRSGLMWGFLADVHRELAQWEEAEKAYLQHQQLVARSREPLLGLMLVHQHRNDLLTAMAYAVRAYHIDDNEPPLRVAHLRTLCDFFSTCQEPHRYKEASAQLKGRRFSETEALRYEIAEERQQGPKKAYRTPTRSAPRRSGYQAPERHTPPPASLPSLHQIPVSTDEQETLDQAVKRLFGYNHLLQAQPQIMASSLRGEDVLAILPTGAGKSLCYQLPAMLSEGVTLVISPLIALMKDQVDGLPSAVRSQTIALNSSMSYSTAHDTINQIAAGRFKLVYVAPERLRQLPFLHALRHAGVARLVIDEAHCISVWGHDFRPDFLFMTRVHRDLGSPPILAMTATAPPLVRQDIEKQLFTQPQATRRESRVEKSHRFAQLEAAQVEDSETQTSKPSNPSPFRLIMTDVYRSNLRLQVLRASDEDEKIRYLLGLCRQMKGSGIVYARTRRHCEQLATLLRTQGFSAAHYHAGIPNRAQVQDRFMSNEVQIIVATIAFGMGVDKSDIRFIIHYGLPKSVEAYYQEAGRAGRDGELAHCILLHTNSDKGTLTRHAREGAIPIAFLRKVYATVRHWLREYNPNTITQDDLIRTLNSDDTTVRVSLSVLERAGLLLRHYDAPRAVTLHRFAGSGDESWEEFCAKIDLGPNQRITQSYVDLAANSQIASSQLEMLLLQWQTAGFAYVEFHHRDLLLELPPPPKDASTRIESLLDQYATIQQQRVIEIADYGRTYYCRHGYLASYLGSLSRPHCNVCDNCHPDRAFDEPSYDLPPDTEQMSWVLRSLQDESWERRCLTALLRGDPYCGTYGQQSLAFGKLGFRSNTAVGKLLDRLIDAKFIREFKQSDGKWQLHITPHGQQALQNPSQLQKA